MLACVLRTTSRIDSTRYASTVITPLDFQLCHAWPSVRIVVLGDSGFCRQGKIRWCEHYAVIYVIGVVRTAHLHRIAEGREQAMERD